MPKIGHIVLHKDTLKDRNSNKILLAEPFSVIYVSEFPHTVDFIANVGLFNLKHSIDYECAYFILSPTGETIEAKYMDISTEPKKENFGDVPIHMNLNLSQQDITFTEEGVYCFVFQLSTLHEEKSCFFYVQKGDKNE